MEEEEKAERTQLLLAPEIIIIKENKFEEEQQQNYLSSNNLSLEIADSNDPNQQQEVSEHDSNFVASANEAHLLCFTIDAEESACIVAAAEEDASAPIIDDSLSMVIAAEQASPMAAAPLPDSHLKGTTNEDSSLMLPEHPPPPPPPPPPPSLQLPPSPVISSAAAADDAPSMMFAQDTTTTTSCSMIPPSDVLSTVGVVQHTTLLVSENDAPSNHDALFPMLNAEEEGLPSLAPPKQVPSISCARDVPSTVDNDTPSNGAQHTPSILAAQDAPLLISVQDAPSTVDKDALSVVDNDVSSDVSTVGAEYNHSMVSKHAPMNMSLLTAKDDEPSICAQTAPSMHNNASMDVSTICAKDAPSTVAEDALSMVDNATSTDVSTIVAEDTHILVSKDAPIDASLLNAEQTPSVVPKDSSTTVDVQEEPKNVAEASQLKVAEDDSPMVDHDVSPSHDDNVSYPVDKYNSPVIDENASPMDAEEVTRVSEVDSEMETEMETEIVQTDTGVKKRKRGRPARVQSKAPQPKRTEEEDVCFICFDGGNLVLCDRRGCPKAYHPACVNRDEAFFHSRGRWNCGWHICSNCEKSAQYMCYTCTYSLCKGCIKEAEFFSVRGNRGFCETCMRTVMLIEKNGLVNKEMDQVDFDDKSSWEYLFKEYWLDLKGKLSLTPDELTQAKNPLKRSNTLARKGESSEELYDANDDKESDTDGSGHLEVSSSTKRKAKRRLKSSKEEEPPSAAHTVINEETSLSGNPEWASNELLEFVARMKNGDKSVHSQFDVQALLLEYIKQNNLRDPHRKSQIVCDSRLANLFGKARVGHFEMLKLLESHFLIKEDTHADNIGGETADTEATQLYGDGTAGASTKTSLDKRRKSRRKGDGRGQQTNLDDYAAIDAYNIKLIYLRRNLMEDLLEDIDKFHDRVVGTFVRIRTSGTGQKQDMYRLVQVVGTRKAAEPYKTGKRSADVVLEILNLNKTDVISIDTISNQEFTEDECKRLRQSVKCGLISPMTLGEVQEKAMIIQAVRVNDWLEMEKLRISHLRDRASEQGRRKDLRECVEKLELLKTPDERFRRLQEVPDVHADPHMDPNHESEEEEEQDDRSQDKVTMSRDAAFSRKGKDSISPGKGSPGSVDTWSGSRKSAGSGLDSGRNLSTIGVLDRGYGANGAREPVSSDGHRFESWEKPKNLASATSLGVGASIGQTAGRSGPTSGNSQENATPLPTGMSSNISEKDKIWYYQDPSGKIQGPFSMVQLCKWSTTGHFPVDLRIWRTPQKQEDSILLNDALAGKYDKPLPQIGNSFLTPEKAVPLSANNWEGNWGSGWEGSTTTAWTDKSRVDRTPNSNWKDVSGVANGSTQLANNDTWGSGSSSWAAPTTNSKMEQSGHSFRGGWDSRASNAWAGRSVHIPHSTPSYSGQPHRPASHQEFQSGGRWNRGQNRGNNWNSNSFRGPQSNRGRGYDKQVNNMGPSGPLFGENWRTPDNSAKGWNTVENPNSATKGLGFNQSNITNLSNLPSPTPNMSRANWTAQPSESSWSPTPASSFPANTISSITQWTGSNGVQASPVGMPDPSKPLGWTEQQHISATPTTGWGPSSGPTSVPKLSVTIIEDERDYCSPPPTPTPAPAPAPAPTLPTPTPISTDNHPGSNRTPTGWIEQQNLSVTPPMGGWTPSAASATSVPKTSETISQDGRRDYSSPPTPTPTPMPDTNHSHP